MTGIRQSFIVSLEANGEFGKGKCPMAKWVSPPPGSYFNSTHNRQTSRIQSTGSKRWDTVAYGSLSGQWEWTFNLDYKYLTPLLFAFENYEAVPVNGQGAEVSSTNATGWLYKFSKMDASKVPSFTVRRKILNYMAGGPMYSDEIVELRGCVCKNFRFTKSESTSQVAVTMTGFYADEKMMTGALDATDFQDYEGDLVEWMCMYVNDGDGDKYVANTDNLGVTIENNTAPVFNTCTPFAKNYSEGLSNYSFTTSCYSTDPDQYKRRLYYGGNKGWDGTKGTSKGALESRPQAKGMAPIKNIKLISYSGTIRESPSEDEVEVAIAESDHRLELNIHECVIKSMTWPKGNGGPIQDSISSAECKEMDLAVFIKGPYIEFNPCVEGVVHDVDSPDVMDSRSIYPLCDKEGLME